MQSQAKADRHADPKLKLRTEWAAFREGIRASMNKSLIARHTLNKSVAGSTYTSLTHRDITQQNADLVPSPVKQATKDTTIREPIKRLALTTS